MVAPSILLLIVLLTASPIVFVFGRPIVRSSSPCIMFNSTNTDTYEFVDDNCVYVYIDQRTIKHREAAKACAERSSHEFEWRLPKLDTDEKNEILRQILLEEPKRKKAKVRHARFWIGLLRDNGGDALYGDDGDSGFDLSNSTSTNETIDYDRWRWMADNESLEWSANLTDRWADDSVENLRHPTPQCVAAYIEKGAASAAWDILECDGADGAKTDSLVCEMVRVPTTTSTTTSTTTTTTTTSTTTTTTTTATTTTPEPTTTSPTPTTPTQSSSTATSISSMETDLSPTEIETDSTMIEIERPTGVRATIPTSAPNFNSPSSSPPVSKVIDASGNGPFESSGVRDENATRMNKSVTSAPGSNVRPKDDLTAKGESSGISWIGLAIGLFLVAAVVVVAVGIGLYVFLVRRPRRRRTRRGKGGAAVISIRGSSIKASDSERSDESSRHRRRRYDDESERV